MISLDMWLFLYFGTFVVLILLQMPITYAMCVSALEFLIVNHQQFVMFAQKTAASFSDFNMLALPSFLFVGCFMNEVGLTDQLFNMCEKWLGHLSGGLAHANILASMIFAGMSGSALADAGGLGTIEVKTMSDAGYDKDFSIAVTAASSGIGPIIPPSINFVVWAFLSGCSTLAMFDAGYLPGILMGVSMMVWSTISIKTQGIQCPRTRKFTLKERAEATFQALPALGGPAILIFGVSSGAFTPAECGTVAAMYCVICAVVLKKFNRKMFFRALRNTVSSVGMSMSLCAAGLIFDWVIVTSGLVTVMSNAILALGNKVIIILFLNVILLFLGCFIGSMQILIMVAPLLMNIANAIGMSYITMGVMAVLNVTIGLITPPMAPALFVTCKATGGKFDTALKYTVQFLIPMVVTLLLVAFVPEITMFIPRLLGAV
ncbi:TRAP transporter large permease [[Clostridium] aminophilum]|uniref:TRAP transporter, DctM subunit n=1 Tax=[Clostridium] aminophilum TaxID=1526 RepID=A0A1I6K2R6_9FIRM|nr:TRAP transporter large permease [[Clostridium] aminophilum]SFR85476.1 TRAP transporter, DctM subunit [[Clostridium] aminophilum]